MSAPLVSVIMPTHNYGRFIGQAIDSFLTQTYPYFELIIVDDASTDNTQEVIDQYDDSRIVVVTRDVCSGSGVFARNDGLAQARGDLIAAADADDIYVRDRLAWQVAYLDAHPAIDILGGAMLEVDNCGNPVGPPVCKPAFNRPERYREAVLQGKNVIVHSTMMFRRHVLDKVSGYNNFVASGDTEFVLRASRYFRIYNLGEVLVYRRLHENSVTKTRGTSLVRYHHRIFMANECRWLRKEIQRLAQKKVSDSV